MAIMKSKNRISITTIFIVCVLISLFTNCTDNKNEFGEIFEVRKGEFIIPLNRNIAGIETGIAPILKNGEIAKERFTFDQAFFDNIAIGMGNEPVSAHTLASFIVEYFSIEWPPPSFENMTSDEPIKENISYVVNECKKALTLKNLVYLIISVVPEQDKKIVKWPIEYHLTIEDKFGQKYLFTAIQPIAETAMKDVRFDKVGFCRYLEGDGMLNLLFIIPSELIDSFVKLTLMHPYYGKINYTSKKE